MQNAYLPLIVAVVGIAGTLGGVFLGQHLSKSAQQDQWLRNARIQEFRELLSALSTAYMALAQLRDAEIIDIIESKRRTAAVELESYRILRDRIHIAVELERENITYRWAEMLENYKKNDDERKFAHRFTSICETVVWLATDKKGPRPKYV